MSIIFDNVLVEKDVIYGEAPQWNSPYTAIDLKADIFQPKSDSQFLRPLLIWMHPGGFLTGTKEADDMQALCDSFARMGYVTASISYRLGFNFFSGESAKRAVYRGTQDARAAIRYFKYNADKYLIDTNYVFIGGSSAGALAALHSAYMDENERPTATYEQGGDPDLGCLDCSGNMYNHSGEPNAVVAFWGALGDSAYRDSADFTPVLMLHGTDDQIVPYDKGSPFNSPTLPVTHGSLPIANQSIALNLPYILRTFDGQGHEPHGANNGDFNDSPTTYWDTMINDTRNFLYAQMFPPRLTILSNDQDSFIQGNTSTYVAAPMNAPTSQLPGSRFCWEVIGGSIVEQELAYVQVEWNGIGQGMLIVQEQNSLGIVGERDTLIVYIQSANTHNHNAHNIDFYPNPATNTIYTSGLLQNDVVSIFDLYGRKVLERPIIDSQINIHFLPSGTYIIELKRSESTIRKIIIIE